MGRRIHVLDVIELDDDLGLFGGVDLNNNHEKVTFHLRGKNAANMAAAVISGEAAVIVEMADA